MRPLGQFLQLAGLVVAPLGLFHYVLMREHNVSEASLMTWELGCLFVGAACFLLGKRLAAGR